MHDGGDSASQKGKLRQDRNGMTICLIGMMGCGKSSVGRRLSELLSLPFVDLDSYIESVTDRRIPEIFASEGEAAFRKMESNALNEILYSEEFEVHETEGMNKREGRDMVLALGGGTLTTKKNAEKIARKTLCIYLKATADTLAERLAAEAQKRPMLAGKELHRRIAELLKEREPMYEKAARHTVETDGLSVAEIARRIAATVKDTSDFQK